MRLNPFYPIVDSVYLLTRLVNAGARLVQLRIKDRPMVDVRNEIHHAQKVCAHMSAQLVVNDYWEIAIDEGCSFVHLGQDDLANADVEALRRAEISIGLSTHSADELERALEVHPDYIALGPIYPTLLKEMPWQPQGLARIGEWKRRIGDLPLVAIGGITLERAPLCLQAGADSIAVATDVVRAENPEQRAKQWMAALKETA